MDIDLHFTSNNILTLKQDYYEFAGGAHGINGLYYFNYNPKTGQQLENNALFDDVVAFTAFAKTKFIKTHGPINQYWFEGDVFRLPKNIGFGPEGMLFFYNVYEIAPYAEGSFELTFTWQEIEDYLSF